MTAPEALLLHLCVGAAAFMYAAVGHGGATAYLAVMAFLAVPRQEAATAALFLNLIVAGASFHAYRAAGRFRPGLAAPFCLLSVPAAWLGASWPVPDRVYELLLAGALSMAALRLWLGERGAGERAASPPSKPLALCAGGAIGLLSGMLGIGGGVILSPLLILRGWADPKSAAAASAFFILVNSAAGLASRAASGRAAAALPQASLALTALALGVLGARCGGTAWSGATLRKALALVLLAANVRLMAG